MFKVGDEVLIKAEVTDLHEGLERQYFLYSHHLGWVSESEVIPADKTYAEGLEEGRKEVWELVRKLGEIEQDEREKMFSYRSVKAIIEDCTIEEVMDRIEAYEKEKEIKVGDEVVHDGGEEGKRAFIVTRNNGSFIYGFDKDGKTHSYIFPNDFIKKTGKHIDIESLLRQIGE